jgi:hypothetical protein
MAFVICILSPSGDGLISGPPAEMIHNGAPSSRSVRVPARTLILVQIDRGDKDGDHVF